MLPPVRPSTLFRNRWIALLWAVGICFMATEIVDSVAGVAKRDDAAGSSVPVSSTTTALPREDALPPGPVPMMDKTAE